MLERDELKYGFKSLGVPISMRDVEDLLVFFDEDRSGGMTVDELLKGLRGKISRKRRAMVKRVFAQPCLSYWPCCTRARGELGRCWP